MLRQWNHEFDSFLCWCGGAVWNVIIQGHVPAHRQSCGSVTNSYHYKIYLWMTPPPQAYPIHCPITPVLRVARSAVIPVHHSHCGPVSHPSVTSCCWWMRRWDHKARSPQWAPLHYSGLDRSPPLLPVTTPPPKSVPCINRPAIYSLIE